MFPPEKYVEGTFLLIDKPYKWTSHDVVNKLRYVLTRYCKVKKLKVGHAGTLDPLATGLLIIATGKFTKQLDTIITQDKTYTGAFTIGSITPTFDAESEVSNTFSIAHITNEMIFDAAKQFLGKTLQLPPAHSAVKVEGKPMYVNARKGIAVNAEPREITISTFNISKINLPEIFFEVNCSKGTYIRTLADDFGKALGSGAYLSQLRRTRIGEFKIEDALSVESFLASLSPDQR